MSALAGKKVIVTGGSRGIGLQISNQFSIAGCQVAIVYRKNKEQGEKALAELQGEGHLLVQCDISDAASIPKMFDLVWTHFGQLDIVVNNAGVGFHHPVHSSDYNQWQNGWTRIIQTNLIGPSNICYQAAQIMIKQGEGTIINVSSRGAFRGEPDQPAYGASKAGLNSLTQSLAYSLAPHNIFVGAVAPGFVNTEMAHERLQGELGNRIKSQSPMNRVADPAEVAQAVLLMAQSNQWMTGGIFDVNGASYFRT